jgi:hypothetical protein
LTKKIEGMESVVEIGARSFSGSNGSGCRLGRMVMAALPDHISV